MREPLEGLLDALEDEFGSARLYRPNRDVRFSADKSPYKDHQGALATTVPGMGFYVQVSADGLLTGGGFYPTGPDQLPRLRAADRRAAFRPGPPGGRRRPHRGGVRPRRRPGWRPARAACPADHPRLELMRFKSLIATREHGAPAWVSTPEAVEHVRSDWRAVRPLVDWLTEHVGATTAPRSR